MNLERFIKITRKCGKRVVADKVTNDRAKVLRSNSYQNPQEVTLHSLNIISPRVTVRTEVRSGQSLQVPAARSSELQEGKAIRILLEAAKTTSVGSKTINSFNQESKANIRRRKGKHPGIKSDVHGKSFSTREAEGILKVLRNETGGEGSSLSKRNTLHRTAVSQLSTRRS